jgi:hypothetical protein
MTLEEVGAKTNWLAANRQSQSNFDSDSDSELLLSRLSQLRDAVVRSEKLVAEAGDSTGTQGKGMSVVERRYQATVSEDWEESLCAVATVIWSV